MSSHGRGKIFINYRRADTRWAAARLYDDLARHFSKDRLFMDVDSIPAGADFVEYLHDYVDQCEAIIVLIGPSWLTLTAEDGTRRIDDPDDFVTIEIKRSLERGVNVIPVLIDGADPPREQDLPDGLKPLARRQALRLHHETYGQEVERVVAALGGADRGRSFQRIAVGASVAAVAIVAAIAVIALWPSADPAPSPPASTASPSTAVEERAFTSFEVNIDRPGGDYTSLRLPDADAILCQKACAEDQRCLAWTYVAPGYQEESAICWLKNTVPQATRRDVCCTSGVAYYRRPQ